MALLEGDERSEMPSMSWNSVVKGKTAAAGSSPDGNDGNDSGRRVAPPPSPQPEPVSFSTSSLTAEVPATTPRIPVAPTPVERAVQATVAPAPVAPAPVAPAPVAPAVALTSLVTSPIAPVPPISVPPAPAPVPPAPVPAPATPARSTPDVIGRSDLVAQPLVPVDANPVAPHVIEVPHIIEATPPTDVAAAVAAVVAQPAPPVAAAPVQAAPVAAVPEPVVASATVPNQSPNLPAAAVVRPSSPGVVDAPAPNPRKQRKQRKDRSGSVARVGLFFLVVAALASAAVIFGRPYLFPADWEPNALDFAEPIETARGTDFVEPILLVPQSTAVHREMVAAQLLGDPASSLPMWRALGLAGPDSTDDATLDALISEQSPVLYSTVDGQVYYDAAFTRSDRAALISRAMATAALDQEFSFSTDAPNRSLDDAALTEANVRQQSAIIAQAAAERGALQTPDMAALSFLPAVLDYRLTAPSVFVDLLPPVNDVAANPLTDLGIQGPGPLSVTPLTQIPSNSVTIGDTVVGSSIVTDRSFWYMSFASHLDAPAAYRMSNQIQSAGLQMVDSQKGRCAVATFAIADAATNATFRADLDVWVAATAPELGATASTMPDGNVQLRSCDPVGAYTSNIRFGVARQLIAWRSVELAVTNLVVAQGGTVADVGAAVARVDSTPAAVAVAQLPAGTTPADLAIAAQAAASDVIAAVALPIDQADPNAPIEPGAVESAAAGEG